MKSIKGLLSVVSQTIISGAFAVSALAVVVPSVSHAEWLIEEGDGLELVAPVGESNVDIEEILALADLDLDSLAQSNTRISSEAGSLPVQQSINCCNQWREDRRQCRDQGAQCVWDYWVIGSAGCAIVRNWCYHAVEDARNLCLETFDQEPC